MRSTYPSSNDLNANGIKGVGGWCSRYSSCLSFPFVIRSDIIKPWITPSVFEGTGDDKIVDEYTLGQYLDPGTAESILKNHWETVSASSLIVA